MKFILMIIIGDFLITFPVLALTENEIEKQKEGLEFWEKESMTKPKSDQDYAYLDNLAAGLRKMPTQQIYSIPEKYEVYKLLQESIIQFPGYANYFRDKLIKLYDDRLNAATDSNEYNGMTAGLPIATTKIYMTLASLPTKETVFALADLYEYSKFDPRPADDIRNPAEPIPMLAGKILNELPIKNRPYPKVKKGNYSDKNLPDLVEKWRLWCRDVKAGKIEPEFGPEVFADGSSIPPISERHQIRAPKPAATKKQMTDTAAVSQESSWPWVTAAGAATLLAGYAAWKVKRNKA